MNKITNKQGGYRICANKRFVMVHLNDVLTELKIWEGNRMIDQKRVEEIVEMYRKEAYEMIPGIIYIVRNLDNDFEIYDGMHRFQAARAYKCQKPSFNPYVKFYILDDFSLVNIDFQNINKSVPVSEIYINNGNNGIRRICEDVVKYLNLHYPDFKKPSAKCRKPHYNQDKFMDDLSNILKPSDNSEKVINALKFVNEQIKNDPQIIDISDISDIPPKCIANNFWLFMDPQWAFKISKRLTDSPPDLINF